MSEQQQELLPAGAAQNKAEALLGKLDSSDDASLNPYRVILRAFVAEIDASKGLIARRVMIEISQIESFVESVLSKEQQP